MGENVVKFNVPIALYLIRIYNIILLHLTNDFLQTRFMNIILPKYYELYRVQNWLLHLINNGDSCSTSWHRVEILWKRDSKFVYKMENSYRKL